MCNRVFLTPANLFLVALVSGKGKQKNKQKESRRVRSWCCLLVCLSLIKWKGNRFIQEYLKIAQTFCARWESFGKSIDVLFKTSIIIAGEEGPAPSPTHYTF